MSTSIKTIKQLEADVKDKLTSAKAIFDMGDEATPEQFAQAEAWTAEAEQASETLVGFRSRKSLSVANRIENTLATLGQERHGRPDLGPVHAGRDGDTLMGGAGDDLARKSIGDQFTSDEAFVNWLKAIAPNGRAPDRLPGPSPAVAVKTLYTGAADRTAGGPLLGQVDRRDEIVRIGFPERIVRALITNATTAGDVVEVVREKTLTNNAATVAEAGALGDTTGTKPESAIEFEVVQAVVKTVAHWIPATTRVLSDARRLRQEIDSFLREGLEQILEQQVLVGDGTGENFLGINNTSGILTEAYDSGTHPLLRTTRKARTTLRLDGRTRPTAYVLHPADWETIDLELDGEDRYMFGGPMVMGTPRLWGVPVFESEFQTEGLGLLGYFPDAVLYDREQTSISVGTVDKDFVRNILRILAEMRAAFFVRRPKSFVQIDLTA